MGDSRENNEEVENLVGRSEIIESTRSPAFGDAASAGIHSAYNDGDGGASTY